MSRSSTPAAPAPPTDRVALDARIARLVARKGGWVRVEIPQRVKLLRACIDGVLAVADEWVAAACRARRIDPRSALAGEEWIAGPMTTVRNLHLLAEALEHEGQPRPVALRDVPNGQVVAKVFPRDALDRFLFYNMSAEVWIEPHQPPTQGRIYRHKAEGRFDTGAVALVLGAGNVSSIAPLDVAYKLFVEDQVVLLKTNPVNEYLAPFFERAFAPLIKQGFLQIVPGGADVGAYLCSHPQIDALHLTGSAATYDAIVWGADPAEREARKAGNEPLVDKPFTAELGCVTPVLVVPGRWNTGDLEFQARHVAAMVAHNASFNCTAGKVLVTAAGWDQRAAFLDAVERALAATAPRYAYYPGAAARYAAFLERYSRARAIGAGGDGVVPWTLIRDVGARHGEYALCHEAFCGVLAEVTLEAADAAEFLARATAFANDDVWGTLSCNVIVDEATQRDAAAPFEQAIADLRYGSICVNAWTGVGFGIGVTTWGAFPGHTAQAIGSGVGVVHNAFLFDHPQKSVVRAPFRIWPKPVWFADHRNLRVLGRRMTWYEAHHSPWSLAALAVAGARG